MRVNNSQERSFKNTRPLDLVTKRRIWNLLWSLHCLLEQWLQLPNNTLDSCLHYSTKWIVLALPYIALTNASRDNSTVVFAKVVKRGNDWQPFEYFCIWRFQLNTKARKCSQRILSSIMAGPIHRDFPSSGVRRKDCSWYVCDALRAVSASWQTINIFLESASETFF